jgi:hypothetical protein
MVGVVEGLKETKEETVHGEHHLMESQLVFHWGDELRAIMVTLPGLNLGGSLVEKNFRPTNEDVRTILKELRPSRPLEPRVGLVDGECISARGRMVPFLFAGCGFV